MTAEERGRLEARADVISLVALCDGRLASGLRDGTIGLWDLATAKETARLNGHQGAVTALAVMRDGRLVSGSLDKTIRLWDTKTASETARLEGHMDLVTALEVLPDGRIASASGDNTIRLWDGKTAVELVKLDLDNALMSLAVLCGSRLAVGDHGGHIHWLEILD